MGYPHRIKVYFNNVKGRIHEIIVPNMNSFGKVEVCGVISEYPSDNTQIFVDMLDIVYKRITIQGFLVANLIKMSIDFPS